MKRVSLAPAVACLLGTMPDHLLAVQAGVSTTTLANWRRKRGIPAYYLKMVGSSGNTVERFTAALRRFPLGGSTTELARELGLSRQSVWSTLVTLEAHGMVQRHDSPSGSHWTATRKALLACRNAHREKEIHATRHP